MRVIFAFIFNDNNLAGIFIWLSDPTSARLTIRPRVREAYLWKRMRESTFKYLK